MNRSILTFLTKKAMIVLTFGAALHVDGKGGFFMEPYTHEQVKTIPHLPIYCIEYEEFRQLSPSHWHDHLEIIYVVEGELYITAGNEYVLPEGEFFIINSNEIHGTSSREKIKALLIQVPYAYLESYMDDYAHLKFCESYEAEQQSACYLRMKALLQEFLEIFTQKGNGYELLLMAKLQEFLYLLYTHYASRDTQDQQQIKQIERLKEVLHYIATNYQEPVTLADAADMAGLSIEYFCRMFKRCMGVTFLEYVNLVRIDHIHEELLSTEDTITVILERNGFSNYKVFRRMFREQFGMTPGELRAIMKPRKTQIRCKGEGL